MLDTKDKGTTILWNMGNYQPNDRMSHTGILEYSSTPMWEPQISRSCGTQCSYKI